mmetsp:Transcript_11897/g.38042  ORF Transcript_11897/g.38042 Transcript_11897/m.38042 type:complete len:334 (-) Transcript_11897:706-1707(-)
MLVDPLTGVVVLALTLALAVLQLVVVEVVMVVVVVMVALVASPAAAADAQNGWRQRGHGLHVVVSVGKDVLWRYVLSWRARASAMLAGATGATTTAIAVVRGRHLDTGGEEGQLDGGDEHVEHHVDEEADEGVQVRLRHSTTVRKQVQVRLTDHIAVQHGKQCHQRRLEISEPVRLVPKVDHAEEGVRQQQRHHAGHEPHDGRQAAAQGGDQDGEAAVVLQVAQRAHPQQRAPKARQSLAHVIDGLGGGQVPHRRDDDASRGDGCKDKPEVKEAQLVAPREVIPRHHHASARRQPRLHPEHIGLRRRPWVSARRGAGAERVGEGRGAGALDVW